jgi:poly(3-hydroxybutyrate) depolymerase
LARKIYRRLIILLAAAVVVSGCGGSKKAGLDAPFAYDSSKSFDLKTKRTIKEGKVEIRDITFQGPSGETIPAYLVVPPGKGRHPAVIYAHGSRGSRQDLVASAAGLGERGAVAISLEMNYSATRGTGTLPSGLAGVKTATNNDIQSVVEVRRTVDLLRSLPYVDKNRIAYVGWSAGARTGAILSGVEHRIKAYDLLAGGAAPVSFYLQRAPKSMRKDLEAQLTKTDPLRYVSHAAPSALLFQDGRNDEVVPRNALVSLAGMGSSPKELHFYSSGHVPSTAAWAYSAKWLSRQLGLTRKA